MQQRRLTDLQMLVPSPQQLAHRAVRMNSLMKSYHTLTVFLGTTLIPLACSTRIQPSPDPTPGTTPTQTQPTSEPTAQPTSEPTATSKPITQCPEGLPGPSLAFIPHPQAPFCMDTTEVSQAQYAQFLADPKDKGTLQPERCSGNDSFQPVQGSHNTHGGCDGEKVYVYKPEKNGNLPIACIDWCDAATYCAWAGKHLCGGIGGGGLDYDKDVMAGQWGYACSQGGKTAYSYGDTFQKGLCVDGTEKPGAVGVSDRPACAGSEPPFSEIKNLNGNILEFEDACDKFLCRIRGLTNPLIPETQTRCDVAIGFATNYYSSTTGFRCCYD
jgi:formylglycine-generating enzyme